MLEDLAPKQKELAELMSDISERCYSAGWMGNLEYVLWYAVQNGPCTYGHDSVAQGDIQKLKALSEACNCWVYFDDETEETSMPVNKWREKFNADVEEDTELLAGISLL